MYKYATFFKGITVVMDYFLLNLALYLSFLLENPDSFWLSTSDNSRLYFIVLNLFWFYSSSLVQLYENIMVREAVPTIRVTILALMIYLLAPLTVTVLLPRFSLPIGFVVNSYGLFVFLIISWKMSFLFIRKSKRRFWIDYQKVVIIGANSVGKELYEYLEEHPHLGYKVQGIFDDLPASLSLGQKHLGNVGNCFDYVLANGVTEVFSALPLKDLEKTKMLMQEADKHMIRFRLVPDVKIFFDKNILLDQYGHLPILSPRREPLDNKANEIIKRLFDICFSSLVIVFLLSWMIPLLAIIIKLESPGPVFFKQLRTGKGNKPFYCLKFRSMVVNSESDARQASKDDKRVTRIGRFLRRSSLDELPQFFNVLLGDMSVVGPRPHMLKHTQDYSLLIEKFMVRHFLTPGITGWAQVNGYRGETKEPKSMFNRVEADLWYLENWSLLLDLKIIFLTIWQGFRGNPNAF